MFLKKDEFKNIENSGKFTNFEKCIENSVLKITVDPVYSERVGAAKSVHNNRVFTIKVFNLTIN
jgi:hypothetical protein